MKKVAIGRFGQWEKLVGETIDREAYYFACVDFFTFNFNKADLVLPLTVFEADILRKREGDRSARHILPTANLIALCEDKKSFNAHVLQSAFAWMIPGIFTDCEPPFPYALKKCTTQAGKDTFIVRDTVDEARYATLLGDPRYYRQACIPGRFEYATHVLIVDGEPFYCETMQYEMAEEASVKGAVHQPVKATFGVDMDESVINDLIGLLRSIGFNGVCCLDYKLEDGKVRLFEINPRVGFSLFRDINRFLRAYENALGIALAGARPNSTLMPSPGRETVTP